MKKHYRMFVGGLALLLLLVASACSGAAPVDTAAEPQDAPPVEDAPSSPDEAAQQDESMPVKDLSKLVATDPATVNLASGEVQLVEFFAFW